MASRRPPRRRNSSTSRPLWEKGKWKVRFDDNYPFHGFRVTDGYDVYDLAFVYSPGRVQFERPEVLPAYVKTAIVQISKKYAKEFDGYVSVNDSYTHDPEVYSSVEDFLEMCEAGGFRPRLRHTLNGVVDENDDIVLLPVEDYVSQYMKYKLRMA